MLEETPFLEAIAESPHDDTPALIFADWLEEQGDPRAELIRIQRLPSQSADLNDPDELDTLKARERKLLALCQSRWRTSLAQLPELTTTIPGIELERGVPAELSLEISQFLAVGEQLFQVLPTIQTLSIVTRGWPGMIDKEFQQLLKSPLLEQLTGFSLQGIHLGRFLSNWRLKTLARASHLRNLRRLNLRQCGIGNSGLKQLVRSSVLKEVTELNLWGNQLSDESMKALARSATFSRLRSLNLHMNRISHAGIRTLANANFVPVLETLSLSHNRLGDRGAELLANSESFTALKSLRLTHCQFGDAAALEFCHAPHRDQWQSLNLRRNSFSPQSKELLRGEFGERCQL